MRSRLTTALLVICVLLTGGAAIAEVAQHLGDQGVYSAAVSQYGAPGSCAKKRHRTRRGTGCKPRPPSVSPRKVHSILTKAMKAEAVQFRRRGIAAFDLPFKLHSSAPGTLSEWVYAERLPGLPVLRGAQAQQAVPLLASGKVFFNRSGSRKLSLHLTPEGRQQLAALKSLTLTVVVNFKPAGVNQRVLKAEAAIISVSLRPGKRPRVAVHTP